MSVSRAIVRERHGDHVRLVHYNVGGSHTWDGEWQRYSPEEVRFVMEYYRRISNVYRTLLRFLPKDGEILEAGSGLGFWVALLDEAGFHARGIDYSNEALECARRTFPDLRFDWGDVRELPFDADSLSGYVSFGVAEHFREGPERVLEEAARVLRPGGTLILSVPWISPLRRCQPRVVNETPPDGDFYQYFFERDEFEAIVEAIGFRPVARRYYGAMKTVRDLVRSVGGDADDHPPSADSREQPAVRPPPPELGLARKLFWAAQDAVFENGISSRLAGHMFLQIAERR